MDDVTHIIEPLNDEQRAAVTAETGHALVLAGAGSGKTRVLAHRVAWLVATGQARPSGVLAVTFTNKASREMRARIETILDRPIGGMWVGTFHGIAHRFLRSHREEAGLDESFQIADADDQFRLVRRLMREMNLDEGSWPPKQAQGFINGQKEKGIRARHLPEPGDVWERRMADVYRAYEAACSASGLVDFAEMLLRTWEVLRERPELLAQYQERFGHLLVDEFQDTNALQYAWISLLAGDRGRLFMVGDDDQSIYGWRGARIENIRKFARDFPGVTTYKLEENYRSTAKILDAANAVIAHNEGRLGKNLRTSKPGGEPILTYSAYNDVDEARFVAGRIEQARGEGWRLDDHAVLYRTSAQSRVIEDALRTAGVAYRIHGGLRFYERAEIKDAVAYLRLVASRDDDAGFERAVNVPARGVGARSVALLREHARSVGTSLWNAAVEQANDGSLSGRPGAGVRSFLGIVEGLAESEEGRPLDELVLQAVETSGLLEHYQREKGERGEARIENLNELVTAARRFEDRLTREPDPEDEYADRPLAAFVRHTVLEAGEGQADEHEDSVQLMTLHAAKGLEFPAVFLCGMEEGLFPHQRSLEDHSQLEEERRLCYVGMTRAKQRLCLTNAESRRLHRQESFPNPSRFLREIPTELVEEVRLGGYRAGSYRGPVLGGGARPGGRRGGGGRWNGGYRYPAGEAGASGLTEDGGHPFALGQRVRHGKFGEGVVLGLEGDGDHARVHVNFADAGAKWLVLAYARLEAI